MKALKNKFWLSRDEMVEEIEAMGFEVTDVEDDFIVVLDEEEEYVLRILQAGSAVVLI